MFYQTAGSDLYGMGGTNSGQGPDNKFPICALVHRPMLDELEQWDSSRVGRTTTRNPPGRTFTLYKLSDKSDYQDDWQGTYQYRRACEAYGLQPVGCADNNYDDWNGVAMATEWGCAMGNNGQLSEDTGWTDLMFFESEGNGIYGMGGTNSGQGPGNKWPICVHVHAE